MFNYTTISNNGADPTIGIIDNLFETINLKEDHLLHMIGKASNKLPHPSKQKVEFSTKTKGKTYDLENMEYDKSIMGKIYDIMQDGIPRTTQAYWGKTSALQNELYEKYGNRPSERSILARFSDIRLNTLQKPSILYAVEEVKGATGISVGKRRFYWIVFDGMGASRNGLNEVPFNECKHWHKRRS